MTAVIGKSGLGQDCEQPWRAAPSGSAAVAACNVTCCTSLPTWMLHVAWADVGAHELLLRHAQANEMGVNAQMSDGHNTASHRCTRVALAACVEKRTKANNCKRGFGVGCSYL